MNLSKSRYSKGVQCRKMLWMENNKPEYYDPAVMRERILRTGNAVGDLAMGYSGEYVEVPYSENRSAMLENTQKLLASGVKQ